MTTIHADNLAGIIQALEQRGVEPFSDDALLTLGVREAEQPSSAMSRPQIGLTALKLLHRARAAEAKVQALTSAQHEEAFAAFAERIDAATMPAEDVLRHFGLDEPLRPSIHPVAAAEAVVADLLANGVELASPAGREALTERLAGVIASTAPASEALRVAERNAYDSAEHTVLVLRARLEALGHPVDHDDGRWWPPTALLVDPNAVAQAVLDEIEQVMALDLGYAARGALIERLEQAVGRVAHRDIKPGNTEPEGATP